MLGRRSESALERHFTTAVACVDFSLVFQTLLLQMMATLAMVVLVPDTADPVAVGFAAAVTLFTLVQYKFTWLNWVVLACNLAMAVIKTYKYCVALGLWCYLFGYNFYTHTNG